jgi:hypothetical protein
MGHYLVDKLLRWLLIITFRVIGGPLPEVGAGVFQGELGLPAELFVCKCRIGSKIENIARSAVDDLIRQLLAARLVESLDHIKDGGASASTQVPCLDARVVFTKVVEGDKMALSQVENVDVVTNSCAIFGCIV